MVEEYYEGLGGVAHMQHADGSEFFACNERQVIEKKVEHDGHRHQVARLRDGQYAALRSERRRDARDGPGQMLEIGRGRKQACIDRIIARISEGWTVSAAHANQWRDKQHWRGEGWRDPVQKIWDRHIDGARRLGRSL